MAAFLAFAYCWEFREMPATQGQENLSRWFDHCGIKTLHVEIMDSIGLEEYTDVAACVSICF